MTHANDRINEDKKPLQYVKAVMVIVTGHSRKTPILTQYIIQF